MRQKRSRGSEQSTQLWPKRPQFQQSGLLLPAWCVGRDTTASPLATSSGGGGPVIQASCLCPGGPGGRSFGCYELGRELGGGVADLGGDDRIIGEYEGQLDGELGGGVAGGERGGGRRGGLGGAGSARLNPRPLRATRPPDSSRTHLAGPASSPGRRRFSCWRRRHRPARPISRAGRPV